MKILITGGAGFIGSHLATLYQGRATIRVLDNLRTGHRHNLAGLAVEFIEGSILDPATVQRAMLGVDYVFHLAAFVSVPDSVRDPATCTAITPYPPSPILSTTTSAHATCARTSVGGMPERQRNSMSPSLARRSSVGSISSLLLLARFDGRCKTRGFGRELSIGAIGVNHSSSGMTGIQCAVGR